jgi:hypothetical protein
MDYKFTLAIYGAKSKEEAIEVINEMLDNRDFYDRKVEENADDEIYIEWPGGPCETAELEELTIQ